MFSCPCCGQETTDPARLASLREIRGNKQERDVLVLLIEAYPRGVPLPTLERALWPDSQGGPLTSRFGVSNVIARLRKVLPAHGWTIPYSNLSGYRYVLEPIRKQVSAA